MLGAKTASPEQLLPNTNVWMEKLDVVFKDVPDFQTPLSLTSRLGGAYGLVHSRDTREAYGLVRDRQGRSIPARMALYTTELLASGFDLSSLPQKLKTELLYLLCLVVEVAEDEILTPLRLGTENSRLWKRGYYQRDIQVLTDYPDVEEFISSARKTVRDIVSSSDSLTDGKLVGGSLVGDLISIMLEQAKGLRSRALYSAKALSNFLEALTAAHGLPSSTEDTLTQLGILRAKPETAFSAVAFITGFGETLASSNAVRVFCNRLISDVAGAPPHGEQTLLTMVLLNACLSVYETGELPVENRRQVFAVRQMTSWLETPKTGWRLETEVCKALTRLFPNVGSVYGPYWEQAINYCIRLWQGMDELTASSSLACQHASLKLLATLESMKGENDDLDEALAAHAEETSLALIHLLQNRTDASNPMSEIVDALLCRRIAKIPLDHVRDLSDLYGVMASESREIQTAAFGMLSKAIAAAQAQISVDVLLEKRGKTLIP